MQCLRDYYRMRVAEVQPASRRWSSPASSRTVRIEGWNRPAYLHVDARRPRRVAGPHPAQPVRPAGLGAEPDRAHLRLPLPDRDLRAAAEAGLRLLRAPFLLGDRIVARVDLKADRPTRRLLVKGAYAEDARAAGDGRGARGRAAEAGRLARPRSRWSSSLAVTSLRPRGRQSPALRRASRLGCEEPAHERASISGDCHAIHVTARSRSRPGGPGHRRGPGRPIGRERGRCAREPRSTAAPSRRLVASPLRREQPASRQDDNDNGVGRHLAELRAGLQRLRQPRCRRLHHQAHLHGERRSMSTAPTSSGSARRSRLHVTFYRDNGGAPGPRLSNQNGLSYPDPSGLGNFEIPLAAAGDVPARDLLGRGQSQHRLPGRAASGAGTPTTRPVAPSPSGGTRATASTPAARPGARSWPASATVGRAQTSPSPCSSSRPARTSEVDVERSVPATGRHGLDHLARRLRWETGPPGRADPP